MGKYSLLELVASQLAHAQMEEFLDSNLRVRLNLQLSCVTDMSTATTQNIHQGVSQQAVLLPGSLASW